MKKMKKILAVVLAMAMVLGMSLTAFAEGDSDDTPSTPDTKVEYGKNSDRGTITVKGFDFGTKENGTANEVPEGFTVTAYPIIKAMYENGQTYTSEGESKVGNNDGTFSSYQAIYGKNEVGEGNVISTKAEPGKEGELPQVKITASQLTAIWDYISKNNADSSKTKIVGTELELSVQNDNTYTATASDLEVGSYLVVVTGSDSKIYNPIVASLYYEVKNNGNTIEGGSVNLADFTIKSTDNWVKVINAPTVDKSVVTTTTENNTTTITNDNHSTANIGDEIEYQIVIDPIPAYAGSYPVLNAVDTLSKGLELVQTQGVSPFTVKVYDTNVDLTDSAQKKGALLTGTDISAADATIADDAQYGYTISKDDTGKTTITIDFVSGNETAGYKYLLNGSEGKKVVISYKAKLTNDAVLNQNANENEVTLNYTKDSKVTGDDVEKDTKDKTYTYTFDIDGGVSGTDTTINATITTFNKELLTKTGEKRTVTITDEETGEVITKEVATLPGAEFTLYKDADCKEVYTNDSVVAKNGEEFVTFNGVIKSTEDGQLPVKGLKAGTYYLKETKAPNGYSLNTQVFKIVITPEYYLADDGDFKEGELKSWTITVNDKDITEGTKNKFTVKHQGTTTKKIVYVNETITGEGDDQIVTDGKINNTEIKNTKLSGLPSTGGIGTTIFTIGGCAIMIIAAGLFFASRRKSSK